MKLIVDAQLPSKLCEILNHLGFNSALARILRVRNIINAFGKAGWAK